MEKEKERFSKFESNVNGIIFKQSVGEWNSTAPFDRSRLPRSARIRIKKITALTVDEAVRE